MATIETPLDYDALDRLLDAKALDTVRELLAQIPDSEDGYAVLRIRLALLDGSLEPSIALQRLLHLMRRDKDWPGAKELYQVASQSAYERHTSSASMSHVPPPVKPKE